MLPDEIKKFITDHPTQESYLDVVCKDPINLDRYIAELRWRDIKAQYDHIIHQETMQMVASMNV